MLIVVVLTLGTKIQNQTRYLTTHVTQVTHTRT